MPYRRPTIMQDGKQRLVARVVVERLLGRSLLTSEIVHHINHDPFDNRLENLQIVTRGEHKKLHPEIGERSRLKKIWHIPEQAVVEAFKTKTATEIADDYGCHSKTITRILKNAGVAGDFRSKGRVWGYNRKPKSSIEHQGE